MEFVKIDGSDNTFAFHPSWAILKQYAAKKNIKKVIGIGEVFNVLDVAELGEFLHKCLEAGAKVQGETFPMTIEELEETMDLTVVMNLFGSIVKTDEAEGKGQPAPKPETL